MAFPKTLFSIAADVATIRLNRKKACKALRKCNECQEPFDPFSCS